MGEPMNLDMLLRGGLGWAMQTAHPDTLHSTYLAVLFTDTTPNAVPCPTCWDATRQQRMVPTDPRCLGTGMILPASAPNNPTGAELGGYFPGQSFPCQIEPGGPRTTIAQEGIVQYTADDLVQWVAQTVMPKRGDVLIVRAAGTTTTQRYALGDVARASDLGPTTLLWQATLEERRRDNIVYRIPIIDPTGDTPGTWTEGQ